MKAHSEPNRNIVVISSLWGPIEFSHEEDAGIQETASAMGYSLEEFFMVSAKEELARRARNIIKFPSASSYPRGL
jgi:hypothetical protein